MILVAVTVTECLVLSAVVLGACLLPLALVGVTVPWLTAVRLVGWGGVVVCIAAIGVHLS